MTKEGKLDVSFLRVDKTKKQIPKFEKKQYRGSDGSSYGIGVSSYFTAQIIKNGFYHPKKTYLIIYQDVFRNSNDNGREEEGQVGAVKFTTPKGPIEIRTAVAYKNGQGPSEWYVIFHEILHSLGFVQFCAPDAVNKEDHLIKSGDIMSDRDSGAQLLDGKRSEYYGHSNANCEMDLRKSVFLEPTENDFQLKPRAYNCKVSLSQKKYNHEHAVECLTRLDF